MSSLKPVFLSYRKEAALVKLRHPWLFSDAILKPEGIADGELCDVFLSDKQTFFGRGYYNSKSKIVVRFLTRNQQHVVDQHFFEDRLRELKAIRERFIYTDKTNAYRLVFGESDGLPGLVLDKYDEVYVMQIHTAGMEMLKPVVVEAIKKVFDPKTLYERSDVNVRLLEGLKECPSQHLFGEELAGDIVFKENGIPFYVDVVHGQKTGFFLDQRENRKSLQKYVTGKTLLNAFCYTAGFSVYAALAGASRITSMDISKHAIEAAKNNFQLNGLDSEKFEFVVADVFRYLSDCIKEKIGFDIIILDPPAFVKNAKSLDKGMAGYLQINEFALKMLPVGGILVSSSCSAFVTDAMFQKMLTLASHRTRCNLKVLEIRHQPPDHPFNLDFPEGKYLKFWVLEKG